MNNDEMITWQDGDDAGKASAFSNFLIMLVHTLG